MYSQLSKIKRGRLLSKIECEVETLWRTDEMRLSQPTVMDEIMNGLDLYKVSLFDATLDMFTGAEDSLLVRFRSADPHRADTSNRWAGRTLKRARELFLRPAAWGSPPCEQCRLGPCGARSREQGSSFFTQLRGDLPRASSVV